MPYEVVANVRNWVENIQNVVLVLQKRSTIGRRAPSSNPRSFCVNVSHKPWHNFFVLIKINY